MLTMPSPTETKTLNTGEIWMHLFRFCDYIFKMINILLQPAGWGQNTWLSLMVVLLCVLKLTRFLSVYEILYQHYVLNWCFLCGILPWIPDSLKLEFLNICTLSFCPSLWGNKAPVWGFSGVIKARRIKRLYFSKHQIPLRFHVQLYADQQFLIVCLFPSLF